MNATIRCGLAASSLLLGVARMADAATYAMPQQPTADRQIAQFNDSATADRAFAERLPMGLGADQRAGGAAVGIQSPKLPVQGGNNLNWLVGGGG